MARGIGGDDGPTLWMGVAVLAVWSVASSWMRKAQQKADEFGKTNYANIVQSETTEEIREMERQAKKIPVAWDKLPAGKGVNYFKALALSHKQLLQAFNVDEARVFKQVEKLSANELRALAYCFGAPDHLVGMGATFTGGIFKWYEERLDDVTLYPTHVTELERMRTIWAKTGLWLS